MVHFATHRPSLAQARWLAAAAGALLLLAAGCPLDSDGGVDLDRAILVNDAADTVLATMSDAVDNGQVVIDDDKAAALVAPEPGATLARDTPPQFAWSLPNGKRGRGTTTSGEFVWLQFSGGGLARTVDVLAVGVSSWTPTADEWAELAAATGTVTLTLTNAALENGVLAAGPFRATLPATFSIAP
jgi:hypothetical protein